MCENNDKSPMNIPAAGRALSAQLLDLVAATSCAGCGAAGAWLCVDCWGQIAGPAGWDSVPGVGRVCSAAPHASPLGRAVVAYKESGARALTAPLSEQLTKSIAAAVIASGWQGEGAVALVPIPARRGSHRQRGGDTLAALTKRSARHLRRVGVSAKYLPLLAHRRDTGDQVGLSGTARRMNMRGAFQAKAPPRGLLVLVDDVVTTGATLAAAVFALRSASLQTGAGPPRLVAATITTAHQRDRPRR